MGAKRKCAKSAVQLPKRTTRSSRRVLVEANSDQEQGRDSQANTSNQQDIQDQTVHPDKQEAVEQTKTGLEANIYNLLQVKVPKEQPQIQQLDREIGSLMRSFFLCDSIPSEVARAAKRALLDQINRVISHSVRRHCITNSRSITLNASQFMKTLDQFGQKYRTKIARTVILEQLEKGSKTSRAI